MALKSRLWHRKQLREDKFLALVLSHSVSVLMSSSEQVALNHIRASKGTHVDNVSLRSKSRVFCYLHADTLASCLEQYKKGGIDTLKHSGE